MPRINVDLSDESHSGWSRLAAQHGVSLAVLFEVLGRHLDEALREDSLPAIMDEARQLTHERRRAGGPRKRQQT